MNTDDLHDRAMALFERVCDLSPAQRDVELREACVDHPELRRQVEALLLHDSAANPFVAAAESGQIVAEFVDGQGSSTDQDEAIPDHIGPYRVIRKVGEGGMGIIYEAQQESPKRRVALKVLRSSIINRSMLKRFQHEAHVLGQLQHPGIAQIFEAGFAEFHQERLPYFVMEFVDGEPLTRFANDRQLGVKERLGLIARVCDAVQHAHQKGIIHRDLKPSNVLVVSQRDATSTGTMPTSPTGSAIDVIGQPKVLDFGIARVTDADLQTVTVQTEVGQLVGTLAYMSPEQIEGDSADLDTRCDVYALGVVLYQLLTGKRPHDLTGLSVAEAARVIRDDQPPPVAAIDKSLRGDVDTIVAKAMEKDRERRYASAAELAADIRRSLTHQPIEARPASTFYQLNRFARRNKGLVAGLAAAFVMLAIALMGTGYGLLQAQASNQRLEEVVDYQSAMLENVNVADMGRQIIGNLRSEARAKLSGDDEVLMERLASFEQVLSLINSTTIANRALDGSIMSPAVAALDTRFADQPDLRAELRMSLAGIYDTIGLSEKSLTQNLQLVETLQTRFGELDPETMAARHRVCSLLLKLGRFEEAESGARKLLDSQRVALGSEHVDTLTTQHLLGLVLTKLTRSDEAEPLLKDSLAALERTVGSEHESSLLARIRLAEHYRQQRDFEKAHEALGAVLAERKARLGPEHEYTLQTMGEIAGLHYMQNNYEQAIAHYRACCTHHLANLGADHPETLANQHGLGLALTEHGDHKEAEEVLTDTLTRRRLVLGADHPRTVSSVGSMARLMIRTQRWAEAEEYQREALAISLRTLGRDNATTLDDRLDLALMLHKGGRHELAEEVGRESAGEFERIFGAEHLRTITSKQYLGKILMTVGKFDEAATLFEEILPICRDKYSKSSALPGTLGQASSTLIALGRGEAAVDLVRELVDWCEERKVPPRVFGKAHVWLGRAFLADDRLDDADSALASAIEFYGEGAENNGTVWMANLLRHAIAAQRGEIDRIPSAVQEYQRIVTLQLNPEDRATLIPELRRILLKLGVPSDSLDPPIKDD